MARASTDPTPSQVSRELVEQFYADVIAGRLEQAKAVMAPDLVVYESNELPWGGTYVGAQGQRELAERQAPHMASGLVVRAVHADGDFVAAELTVHTAKGNEPILLSEHMRVVDGHIVEQRVFVFGHDEKPVAELF